MTNHLLNWDELTPTQRNAAVLHRYNELLEGAAEGSITFDGAIGDGVGAAWKEAQQLQTPWFFSLIIHEKVGDLLRQVASSEAQEMMYVNPAEPVWISDCVLELE